MGVKGWGGGGGWGSKFPNPIMNWGWDFHNHWRDRHWGSASASWSGTARYSCMSCWQKPFSPHSHIHTEFYCHINKICLPHRICKTENHNVWKCSIITHTTYNHISNSRGKSILKSHKSWIKLGVNVAILKKKWTKLSKSSYLYKTSIKTLLSCKH